MIHETGMLLDLKYFRDYSDTFIETGTCMGDGVLRAINAGFTTLRSVEFWPDFFGKASHRFKDIPEVKIFWGKSWEKMAEMLEGINKPAVIVLDAHPAGPGTAGHDDLMEHDKNSEFYQHNIIMNELSVIFQHRNDHIIIIDDMNELNSETEQYIKLCFEANPKYDFFFYDEQMGTNFYKNKSIVCIPSFS